MLVQNFLRSIPCAFLLLFINSLVILYSIASYAQAVSSVPKTVNPFLYQKLLKTKKEYELALVKGDSLAIAELCYLLGKRYTSVGDYGAAQQYFVRSLQIREPRKQYEGIGKVYLFMGHHQIEQKNYVDAKQMVWRATTNFKKGNNTHGLMSASLATGSVHALGYALNLVTPGHYPSYSLDSALYYFQQAETLALKLKKPADIANVYYTKSLLLAKVKPRLALVYSKKAHALFLKEKVAYPIISSAFNLVDIYLTLDQPVKASQLLSKAQYIIDTARLGDYKQQAQLFQSYTRLNAKTGHWYDAFKTYQQYHDLTVETLNTDREGAIARIHIKYETQKKEAQIEWQRQMIVAAIVFSVIAIFASIVLLRFLKRYKQLSHQNEALVKEQTHRVKNNFQEVINLLTLQSNRLTNEEAQKAVKEGLLRMEAMALVHQRLYYNSNRLVEINLESFIPDLIQGVLRCYNYEHLEGVYKVGSIWLHVDQALPLGLIINELVTNSCKYAFASQRRPTLQVSCQQKDNTILLEIADYGPGFGPKKQYKTFGLKLVQAFTQRLDGQASFGSKGNTFQLSFPIHVSQTVR